MTDLDLAEQSQLVGLIEYAEAMLAIGIEIVGQGVCISQITAGQVVSAHGDGFGKIIKPAAMDGPSKDFIGIAAHDLSKGSMIFWGEHKASGERYWFRPPVGSPPIIVTNGSVMVPVRASFLTLIAGENIGKPGETGIPIYIGADGKAYDARPKQPDLCPHCGAEKVSPLSDSYKCWSVWIGGTLFRTIHCTDADEPAIVRK